MIPIPIKNKLEILPGNVLRIPGCEPVTSFTSLALAANVDCNASIISLEDAVAAIEEASGIVPCIVKVLTPAGVPGTGKFLELPSGPPPNGNQCPSNDILDWYQILKDAAEPIEDGFSEDDDEIEGCSGFNFSGKVLDQDHFHRAPNPDIRPSTRPLGGVKS